MNLIIQREIVRETCRKDVSYVETTYDSRKGERTNFKEFRIRQRVVNLDRRVRGDLVRGCTPSIALAQAVGRSGSHEPSRDLTYAQSL